MFISLQHSCETSVCLVIGGGAWGLWQQLGHEGAALMNGISALVKGTPGNLLTLFLSCEDTTR